MLFTFCIVIYALNNITGSIDKEDTLGKSSKEKNQFLLEFCPNGHFIPRKAPKYFWILVSPPQSRTRLDSLAWYNGFLLGWLPLRCQLSESPHHSSPFALTNTF